MISFLANSKQERNSFDFPLKVLYENRYCNQDDFSILVCGGLNKQHNNWKSIFKLNGPEFVYEHLL